MGKLREGKFCLGNFERDDEGAPRHLLHPKKWIGHAVVAAPFEAHTKIDFTSPLGGSSGIYYALCFQLRKWEFEVQKADEWIEVSPVFTQYYQLTQKQKEELEGRIKAGLASASQAVADLELLQHDERKYKEFLNYMGYRTYKEIKKKKEEYSHQHDEEEIALDDNDKDVVKRKDEHYMRSIFIDQVDKHTGEGISMLSIVQRWPTLIVDFQRLIDEDVDVGKVASKLDISRAEATVLVTKNKLYLEWKKLFLPQLKSRYSRIRQLVRSREKSVEEYREWLKPVIARHKLINEGLSESGTRKKMKSLFVTTSGHATSFAHIELWTWRDLVMPEFYKVPGELVAKGKIEVDDKWTMKNFIFHKKYGLITEHPWITDEWVKKMKEEIYNEGLLKKNLLYYTFFIITLTRSNIRMATGAELEDGIFDVNAVLFSQNALFAKLLQLKAKQEEFDNYVDSLLGVSRDMRKGIATGQKEKKSRIEPVKKFFDYFNPGIDFRKPGGPYERDFDDRVTKYWAASMASLRYGPIVEFIKKKAGYGVS